VRCGMPHTPPGHEHFAVMATGRLTALDLAVHELKRLRVQSSGRSRLPRPSTSGSILGRNSSTRSSSMSDYASVALRITMRSPSDCSLRAGTASARPLCSSAGRAAGAPV
jgi:hypothetical protein